MKIKKEEIREFVSILGFKPQDGDKDIYYKCYPEHDSYVLKINFDKEIIEYGTKIQKGDATTSNFENSENFVVLECMNRVLEKGYPPQRISLEHKWPLGRKEKGKLDILICDRDDKVYLMIECKTWGDEYDKEKKRMQFNGGQLFSYFQQNKSPSYLCLYTSRLEKGKIEFVNDIVKVDEKWRELNNQKEVFDHWNKNFKDNGIFEEWANAYNVEIKALILERLKELTEEDSGRIFNQFAEILRHNVVSDKPNAFNKIFNLFLCKIVDENRDLTEELKFQWLENDTHETLQKRLSDLYKQGMKEYLTKEVTDYNDDQVDDTLISFKGLDSTARERLKEMFTRMRLYKNNEFAFKEVFDEKSFLGNAIVVREVVELLQPFQIRYRHKQQFLGDFFELLLSTGIKQEAGQFFTPVPITKFIISSLPIRELIEKKIERNETNFLPYMIDYAAGSGHFLTEAMDEVQTVIESMDTEKQKSSVKPKIKSWIAAPFDWALEYLYGIEADYRLVKTAKVSCFLNGDGLANMIHADGLGHFQKNTDYKGKLKEVSQEDKKDNGQFDILVANPPYSVSAFKNTLKFGDESFELYNRLTDNSSEIECLFIERTKQLLKVGGWAGIILPSSILSNSGIYTDAREIILKYFDIKAIAEFGSSTFMATGTNTVALFLERKPNSEWKKINQAIENFFDNPKEATVHGIEKAFSKYVEESFNGLELNDYLTLINKSPNGAVKKQELFTDYKKWFDDLTEIKQLKDRVIFKEQSEDEQKSELDELFYEKVFAREMDKMLYFFIVYLQQTVLIKVGEKQDEKDFIGYEFSNRRGHEGIKLYRDENNIPTTKLYDEQNHLNPEKANSYIYKAFLHKTLDIPTSLSNNIALFKTTELMDFKKLNFEKSFFLGTKKKAQANSSQWELVKIGSVTSILNGGTPDTTIRSYWNGDINWATLVDTKEKYLYKTQKTITEKGRQNSNATLLPINTVIFSSRATIGDVTIAKVETCTNQGYKNFVCDENQILYEYLYYILKRESKNISDLASGMIYKEISKQQISDYKIPLPPKSIQKKIISEVASIEQKEMIGKERIEELKNKMNIQYENDKPKFRMERLSNHIEIISGGTPSTEKMSYWNGDIPWLSVVDFNNDNRFVSTSQKKITEKGLENSSTQYLKEGDLIISARGTVGAIAQLAIPMTFNQSCYGLRGKDGFDNGFLYYALKYEIQQLKDNSSGAIFDSITTKTFDSIYIPAPKPDQQKQIVADFEKMENEITNIRSDLANMENEKEQILKKYLE